MSGDLPKARQHIVEHFSVVDLVEAAASHYLRSHTIAALDFCERLEVAWSGLPLNSRKFIRRILRESLERQRCLNKDGLTLIQPVAPPLDAWVKVWELAKGETS